MKVGPKSSLRLFLHRALQLHVCTNDLFEATEWHVFFS